MSALDCDLDFDAQRGQRDDRNLMVEPWKLFGCDECEESTEAKESDGFRAAISSVTQKFCLPDRTTLAEKEQSLSRLLREQPALAKLSASTLERGRTSFVRPSTIKLPEPVAGCPF